MDNYSAHVSVITHARAGTLIIESIPHFLSTYEPEDIYRGESLHEVGCSAFP